VCIYQNSEAFIRREITLSAKQNGSIDWLREQNESYIGMDAWQQMAYILALPISLLMRENTLSIASIIHVLS